jgi:hypothetical protein
MYKGNNERVKGVFSFKKLLHNSIRSIEPLSMYCCIYVLLVLAGIKLNRLDVSLQESTFMLDKLYFLRLAYINYAIRYYISRKHKEFCPVRLG